MRRLFATVLVITGCYSPVPPEGIPCGADLICPESLKCSFGKCIEQPAPCIPIENGAGKLRVPELTSPITVDGDLADWPNCFVTLDTATAGLVRDLGAGGRFTTGRFSVAADAGHVYVAAEAQRVDPLGDQPPPDVYLNNAISVYFDGNGSFSSASYDRDAAQIVVDHANRVQGFSSGEIANLAGFASGATVGAETFTIEMSVSPSTFGLSAFGTQIGFDIGLVGGDGATMTSELVWFQACKPPACGCTNGDAAPYCDERELGIAALER